MNKAELFMEGVVIALVGCLCVYGAGVVAISAVTKAECLSHGYSGYVVDAGVGRYCKKVENATDVVVRLADVKGGR